MLYKEKNDIIEWLDKYEVKNYTLRPDDTYGYVVDVTGNVLLFNKNLTEISVKFGTVSGDFDCAHNKLTSLDGCALYVRDNFYCSSNQLTCLSGAPENVGWDFYCADNKLTSLIGCPRSVGGDFLCTNSELISLNGSPKIIGGGFYCDRNKLTSLEGSPEAVGEDFLCGSNQLNSLQGIPQTVGAGFYCDNNPDLGELQKMESFQEIKAYLLSKKLVLQLPYDLDKNNRKIKL